ncbi:MAG: glycosyltransferase [Desulforhopalus sp.]|nr:glycosyltransferase [Desulforhopalus sp.]
MSETTPATRNILILSPQPFFQNRGTPIAVRILAQELALLGHSVHLLVYHEGEDIDIPGVVLHRIPKIWGVNNIPPSLSWKKLLCDVFMFFKAIQLHRRYRYEIIHAVEESAFMALVMKKIFGTPYIYDMDSSLAAQVIEKFSFLRPLRRLLEFFERLVINESFGVVAVCKALEDIALACSSDKLVVRLEDVSLLETTACADELLRQRYNISGPIMLYVGNLEKYQGIDLLLEGFQLALQQGCQGNVVIIGGTEQTIAAYKKYAEELDILNHTYFCGPRPVALLGYYLAQADILLSPRIQGDNTPMKLYSYLDSGKVVLATNLPTHTQVLQEAFACLVEPTREGMAGGMVRLLGDAELRDQLGKKGGKVAREKYSLAAFKVKLKRFYQEVSRGLQAMYRTVLVAITLNYEVEAVVLEIFAGGTQL